MTLREQATRLIYAATMPCLLVGLGVNHVLADSASVYDSGWATAEPVAVSPLGSGGVPVQQLLSGKMIDSLKLSKPEPNKGLGFRKPALKKPEAASDSGSAPGTDKSAERPILKWRSALGSSGTPAGPSVDSPRIARAFELPAPALDDQASDDQETSSSVEVSPPTDAAKSDASKSDVVQSPAPAEKADREPAPDQFEEIFEATRDAMPADEPAPFPGRTITIAPESSRQESSDAAADRLRKLTPRPEDRVAGDQREKPSATPNNLPVEKSKPLSSSAKAETKTPLAETAPVKRSSPKADEEIVVEENKVDEKVASKPRSTPEKQKQAEKVEAKSSDSKPELAKRRPSAAKDDLYVAAPKQDETLTLKPLTRRQQYLRRRLRSVLSYYYRIPLNSRDHDPWEVMHGMLAYGLHSRVLDAGPRGEPITAVGYLCFNKPCKRQQLLYLTPTGEVDVRVGVGLQGHKGQLLAMLAQCGVSTKYPVRVEGKELTVENLIRAEQRTCYARTELTFKLIALMHYLQSDATWVNDQGEAWDIPRLIADERTQKIRGAACGGTHRLSGLSLAVKKRAERGEPIDGEFAEAAKFVETYQNYAFRLQNSDGSFSTEWFRGPGDEEDINRRVRTTGHLLEWLVYSLPEEKMHYSRTVSAVSYLSNLLASNTDNPWEVGPLSHALHALLLYDQKVFQPYDNLPQVASKTRTNRNGQRVQTASKPAPQLIYHRISSKPRGSYTTEKPKPSDERDSSPLLRLFGGGRRSRR